MSEYKKKTKRTATPINKRIGEKIKSLRIESGLSQEKFAEKYYLSQNDITNIENGYKTVSYELLLDIAKDYNGVTTDYLIKENGARVNSPDIQFICDYTGLRAETIRCLHDTIKYKVEEDLYYKEYCNFYYSILDGFCNLYFKGLLDSAIKYNTVCADAITKVERKIKDKHHFYLDGLDLDLELQEEKDKIGFETYLINKHIASIFDDALTVHFAENESKANELIEQFKSIARAEREQRNG